MVEIEGWTLSLGPFTSGPIPQCRGHTDGAARRQRGRPHGAQGSRERTREHAVLQDLERCGRAERLGVAFRCERHLLL